MEQLLTYGLQEGVIKHISEVNTGIACNCVCAKCGHSLIAKNSQGNKRVAHFAHDKGRECKGAVETALHLLAKAVLSKTRRLRVPDYHYDYNPERIKSKYQEGSLMVFDEVLLEQTVQVRDSVVVPDAICKLGEKVVFVEFANTHFIEEDKMEKLAELDVACIEIDISKQELNEEKLVKLIESKASEIYWTQNPRLDTKYHKEQEYRMKLKEWKSAEKKRKQKLKKQQLEKLALEQYMKHRLTPNLRYSKYNSVTRRVDKCPKEEMQESELRSSNFYNHPALRRIIEGESWNGEIYGRIPNAKYIYLGKERLEVYPKEGEWVQCDQNQQRYSKTFYAGLKQIQKNQSDFSIGRCESCPFAEDTFTYQNRFYSVCNFQSGNK